MDDTVCSTAEVELREGNTGDGEQIGKCRAGRVPATFLEAVLGVVVLGGEVELVENPRQIPARSTSYRSVVSARSAH